MGWPFGKRAEAAGSVLPQTEEQLAALVTKELAIEVKKYEGGCWRCGGCSKMQPNLALQGTVEDSVMRWDPAWSVKERQLAHRYNGHFTGWCLRCCNELMGNQ